MDLQPYLYLCDVLRWRDGDTVEMIIDLGMDITLGKPERPAVGRLVVIDTPEKKEPNYIEAGEFARHMAPEGSKALVRTVKVNGKLKDNFGRYFVIMYSLEGDSINDALLAAGLAEIYKK
jgi:endonuclease YncB( thermonuclease family)